MSGLKKHIKIKKNHKCDSCEKSLSQAGAVKKHFNAFHNGLKDHKCDACEKTFSQARNLKTHINVIHNGQKDHLYCFPFLQILISDVF